MPASTTSTLGRDELAPVAILATVIAMLIATTTFLGAGTASAATRPGKPTNLVGIAQDASVALTWTAPQSRSRSAITEYRIKFKDDSGSSWSKAIRTKSTDTSFTVSGLTNGASYVFKVKAKNRARGGRWSARSLPVTPTASSPKPPTPAPTPTTTPTTKPTPEPPTPAPTPTTTPTTKPTPEPPTPAPGTWWAPAKGTSWQWQLTGSLDTSVNAAVFDIDGEDNSAAKVATLHAKGAKVICYFSAGSWEDWRSDGSAFPASVKGKTLDGWPDEKWLDVRQLDVLLPIMEARIANCAAKGFDAVEPDNVDSYTNNTGFPLTAGDQITYNKALADLAHKHGLGVALKNDPDQVKALQPYFDFSVAEECARYNECDMYAPFTANGKAVLHVEYQGTLNSFCPSTTALGFSSMKKKLDLTAWREVCA